MMKRVSWWIALAGPFLVSLIEFPAAFGQQQADWSTQAASLRGKNGQHFTFVCPGGGTTGASVWGTNLYTDDSSICSAAVHKGLITAQRGGTVTIEIRAGASAYTGSSRNGVTSRDYGAWHGSYVFVSGSDTGTGAITVDWNAQADKWRGRNGEKLLLTCPGGGALSSRLWGTDTYTDDSSICTAAVHAGLINAGQGGTVKIEILPGAAAYQGSTRNGVTSREYGSFSGSFRFLGDGGGGQPLAQAADWSTQADRWRGQNSSRFTLSCPAGGTISSRLWGTGTYTDDSSICTAAVHAGLITVGEGGSVTIEIRPGASSYQGSSRNGVTSRDYGSWTGSFVFVRRQLSGIR
ncbi:MAG: hypothetical protein EHM61_25600 [Acidobacteria bacterium]|nr:MAG: hypothetical protein EHM61_25600 [Acidobacteriota bacterium]